MTKLLIRFAASESGVTAIEYALMLGLMVLVILTAVSAVGTKISNDFYGPLSSDFP
jgi:pilus assembly protein Flp/PilA